MGSVKVTMAIPNSSFAYSFVEQTTIAIDEITGIAFNSLIFSRWNGNANIFLSLREILITVSADSI